MLAYENIKRLDDRCPKLVIYISGPILNTITYQYISNNALHDLSLIKIIVPRFVGTGVS